MLQRFCTYPFSFWQCKSLVHTTYCLTLHQSLSTHFCPFLILCHPLLGCLQSSANGPPSTSVLYFSFFPICKASGALLNSITLGFPNFYCHHLLLLVHSHLLYCTQCVIIFSLPLLNILSYTVSLTIFHNVHFPFSPDVLCILAWCS